MLKSLCFGINGQDGSYLAELLLSKGYEVFGVRKRDSNYLMPNIDHIKGIELIWGDLSNNGDICRIINDIKPDELYNLAAQSVCEESYFPVLSAQKIKYVTFKDFWEEQVKKKKPVIKVKKEELEIEAINLGEHSQLRALGYWNGMGTWFPIKQISRHYYEGKIAKVSQKFGEVMVTPNHSLLDIFQKVVKPSENVWLLNIRKLNYKPNKFKDKILLKIKGRYYFDNSYCWLDEIGTAGKLKKVVEKEGFYSLCRFLGAFISEGHTAYNKHNKTWEVVISNNNKEWLEDIKKDLETFHIGNTCFVENKKIGYTSTWNLRVKSRVLYKLLKEWCGSGAGNKQLPDWFFQIENKYLQELFNKLIEGDGCFNKDGTFRYTTISYKLACQLGALFTLLNKDYTFHREDNEYGVAYHFRQCYSYQPHQGENTKKVEYVDYKGWVYDLSIGAVQNFTVGIGNIVVHNSDVRVSFDIPEYTTDITGLGALRILEAVRKFSPNTKVYQASSSEMFGSALPKQNENTAMMPNNPYACAKLLAHNLCRVYRDGYGMFVACGILFNHESERRGLNFVTRKITNSVAKIKRGELDRFSLGNLQARRDWGYAPEYVEAMWRMLQYQKPEDFVVATGETHTIEEFAEEAFKIADLGKWSDYVIIDKKLYRANETSYLCGDATKAKNILGWEAKTKFKELVQIMVQHDLKEEMKYG